MDDDHEFALEISLQNIDDTNESDEDLDEISVMSGSLNERFDEEGADTKSNGAGSYHSSLSNRLANGGQIVSLKQILEDERSFMLFRRFVKDGCISRNLQFWLACEDFRRQPYDKNRLLEAATAIYRKFLSSSSPLLISVLDGTKKKIHMTIRWKAELNHSMFLQAQNEVYHQMECNELRQFLLSDSFSECTQFNNETAAVYFDDMGLESFQPATYRGGSLHSGSDDSTSITSFNSDMSGTVLCVPHHTKPHLLQSPRNAHSDTEHYSSMSRSHMSASGSSKNSFFSRGKSLTSREFYESLYEKLALVERDRATLQRKARNIAREEGKSYEDIMSLEWYDSPDSIKYSQFSDKDNIQKSMDTQGSPLQQRPSNGDSHIVSMAAREIQQALKDMEITRQVRQNKRTTSILSTSSASSYLSDSGVGDSYLPSSGGSGQYVQAYVQNQHKVTSQLSDREQKANLAATMLINNSTHHEDLNPNSRRGHYRNYPGAYSSDDSSSCFTTTSLSSNSEFFIPRRTHTNITDSEDSRQYPRYPPGMRKMNHKRSNHNSSQQPRYFTGQQQQQTMPHQQTSSSLIQQQHQQQQPQPSFQRDVTTSVPKANNEMLLVAYTLEGFNGGTLAKRLPSNQLYTLGDFKEKVFQRRGLFRFFFKTFCEDLEIMEELSDDGSMLPRFQGKIIGHVEKVEPDS